jgi:hypothetical protein
MSFFILDSTTKTIKAVMSGSAATTNPSFTASYADNTGTSFTEGANDGAMNGTSDVTLVSAPLSSTRRVVKGLTITNIDTAAVTITIKYDNNGTQRTIAKVTLQVNDSWTTDGTFDSSGSLKQTFSSLNLSTSVTGTLAVGYGGTGNTAFTSGSLLKGAGTSAITVATANVDYLVPPPGTSLLKANSNGGLANATAGTDYLAPPLGTSILKANGGGALANATAGTDYVAPSTATTFTATQTFNGSTSALAQVLLNSAETTTVTATAATGTINFDVTTQSILYYTSNASANWTLNFRASSGTSLNTAMSTGQTVTATFLATQGTTAYYANTIQVDGSNVTPKYQGGSAWSSGNASGIDAYTFSIVKTGSATFTVFASQTRFA